MEMTEWTTLLPRKGSRQTIDFFSAVYLPTNWAGHVPTAIVTVYPECAIQWGTDDAPAVVARGESIERWLTFVCGVVKRERAGIILTDTSEARVEAAAQMVASLLPDYRRVALERALAGAVGVALN